MEPTYTFIATRRRAVPMVGKKHYAYTAKGMAKAKAAAKKAGKPVKYGKKKKG